MKSFLSVAFLFGMQASALSSSSTTAAAAPKMASFAQGSFEFRAPGRGCHLITREVQSAVSLRDFSCGLCNVFVQHTSCSLTINENADPTVREDMERALNKLVPVAWCRDGTFQHLDEGDDDMPAHVKASMLGTSLTIPVRNGRLALGTWQGIYLCEHRDKGGFGGGHTRSVIVTVHGQLADRLVSDFDPSLTFDPAT